MEEIGLPPCALDPEVEEFRQNLTSREARENFYEAVTHPFPRESEPDVVPSRASKLGDTELPDVKEKRSISQEILNVAYATEKESTSDEPTSEVEVGNNDSTKSIFESLIMSPSPASSQAGRVEVPGDQGIMIDESDSETLIVDSPRPRPADARPRYYINRATTLPAKLQCQPFDPSKNPKLTRWENFKRKFYLGAAHNMPPRACAQGVDADTSRASTAGPIDTESFCEVTNIEGLDLEGVPPMTQRSRKLFSWTRLKTSFPFKRKGGKGKHEGEAREEPEPQTKIPEVEDEDEAETEHGEKDEEEAEGEKEDGGAKAKTEKERNHSWFEVLAQRLFMARRHRPVEEAPPPTRPATAHTQQYYEIESNW